MMWFSAGLQTLILTSMFIKWEFENGHFSQHGCSLQICLFFDSFECTDTHDALGQQRNARLQGTLETLRGFTLWYCYNYSLHVCGSNHADPGLWQLALSLEHYLVMALSTTRYKYKQLLAKRTGRMMDIDRKTTDDYWRYHFEY